MGPFSQSVIILCAFSSIFLHTITAEQSESLGTPEGRVLILERFNQLNNKTVKILTGQQRPPPPPPQQISNYRPMPNQNTGYYPNPNTNQYPPQFPQSPTSDGDQFGQGSGPQPSYQQQPSTNLHPPPPPPPPPQEQGQPGVSEIYVQIIGAIEKLVGRIDKLDSRLSTLENVVLHLTNKKDAPVQGSCPKNFVKIDGIRGKCYHVSTLLPPGSVPLFDWTTAHGNCGKMGGRLVEMVHYDDFLRISQFLVKYSNFKDSATSSSTTSTDFWIGGINPGLIWIWSESGQKVDMDKQFWNDNDNSSNAPGCLKLSYSKRLDAFFFKGAPCSHKQNMLCEMMDNSVSRALAEFEQELFDGDDQSAKEDD